MRKAGMTIMLLYLDELSDLLWPHIDVLARERGLNQNHNHVGLARVDDVMGCVDGNINGLAGGHRFLLPPHDDLSRAFNEEEDLGRIGVAVKRVFLSRLDAVHIEIKLSHFKEALAHKSLGVKLDMVINL